ncbi:MAG: dehydrogenase, partial [Planctomycetota bacterium]
ELTGSNRANLDYILENLVDPSAAIGKDYRLTTVVTNTGRVLSGIVKAKSGGRLTLDTETERTILPISKVLSITEEKASMMPEGLLKNLSNEDIRDLIAYLATSKQVPLPKEESKK